MALNVNIQPLKNPSGTVPFLCHHVWRKVTESGKFCLIHSIFPLIQVDELPLYLRFGSHRKELYQEALTECLPADGWSQPFYLSGLPKMNGISKRDAHYNNPASSKNFAASNNCSVLISDYSAFSGVSFLEKLLGVQPLKIRDVLHLSRRVARA